MLGCAPAPAPSAVPPPPEKTVQGPITRRVDEARAVQHTVDAGVDDRRKAIDAEQRGDNPP
jgi:hypothetical protein